MIITSGNRKNALDYSVNPVSVRQNIGSLQSRNIHHRSHKAISSHMNHWLAQHYGSRRGFALTWWHRMLYQFGSYREYRRVDWKSVERLVFVCKGNICRSAFAEAVALELGLDSISGGIDTIEGAPANSEAVGMAAIKGINLNGHRTRPMHSLPLKKGDVLIAMEPWQAGHLEREFVKQYGCTLLGLWGTPERPYIHDPYGASAAYFETCFSYIEQSVQEIVRKVS